MVFQVGDRMFAYINLGSIKCQDRHMGFERKLTDRKIQEMPEICDLRAFSNLLPYLAGDTSRVGNTLLPDFICLAHKLEQLGFTYSNGEVLIMEPSKELKNV